MTKYMIVKTIEDSHFIRPVNGCIYSDLEMAEIDLRKCYDVEKGYYILALTGTILIYED